MAKTQISELTEGAAEIFGFGYRSESVWESVWESVSKCGLVRAFPVEGRDEDETKSPPPEKTQKRYWQNTQHPEIITLCKRKLPLESECCLRIVHGRVTTITKANKLKLFGDMKRRWSGRLVNKRFVHKKTARDPISDWFRKYAGPAVEDILNFCKQHEIVEELKGAVTLAEQCFQPSAVCLEEDIDPETDDTKIVIIVKVRDRTPQAIMAAYDNYVDQVVRNLPRSKSGLIRLSYEISA